tara:strand:+ start:627 stop:797 length:171 start_codon:yes stop_codon:yes gene_type:complete
MEAIISNIKIWGIVGLTQATIAMDDFGTEAQIIMHLSAAIASLSIAWWHIFRRGDK